MADSAEGFGRKVFRAAVTALAVAALTLAVAAPASAHDSLVSATPAAGSTVTKLPSAFSVTMNEPLADLAGNTSGFAIEVVDAAGRYYGDGCFTISNATLSTPAALGAPGTYTLLWQVVSADGHTASDKFVFVWAPAASAPVSVGTTAPPVCGATTSTGASTALPSAAATAAPIAGGATGRPQADLGVVLWIGAGIGALLFAALVAVLILGRRPADKRRGGTGA